MLELVNQTDKATNVSRGIPKYRPPAVARIADTLGRGTKIAAKYTDSWGRDTYSTS